MNILLVEDQDDARRAMQRYFEIQGFGVTAVGSPTEALRSASSAVPDVLVCDWELNASQDGVDIARAIQNEFGSSVVFITRPEPTGAAISRIGH